MKTSCIEKIAIYLTREARMGDQKLSLSLLEHNPECVLLDCGCNNGEFTLEKAKKIGTNIIYGIDILEENVTAAQSKGIKVYQQDLNEKFPFADEFFDVVTASHIIEHLSNTDQFLQEVYRVLKSGGYAVISTPNLSSLHNILYLVFARQPPLAKVSDEIVVGGWGGIYEKFIPGPSHRRMFTLAALKGLCEYYGLYTEKSIGSGFYPLPPPVSAIFSTIAKVYATHISIKVRKQL